MREATPQEIKRFVDYRAKHVALVQRIAKLVFGLDCSDHDHDKIECSAEDLNKWALRNLMQCGDYQAKGEDKRELLHIAAKHMKTQPHHPQYWDDSLTVESLTENPNLPVDLTSMPNNAILQMCCDWAAVAIKRNQALFSFYNSACTGANPHFKLTCAQKRFFISNTRKILEAIPKEKLYWDGKEYNVKQVDPIIEDDDLMDLRESILDMPRKEYCKDILTKDGKLKPVVLEQIKSTIEKWKNQLDVDFEIKAVEAKGSLLSKRYNDTSDLDVTIFTDLSEDQVGEIVDIIPKGENIKGTDHPLDFYVLGNGETIDEDNLDNIYDVLKDEWIKRTRDYENEIPTDYLIQVCNFYINGCVIALNNYRNDKTLLEYYQSLNSATYEISEDELKSIIEEKKRSLKADFDALKMALHMITAFRLEAYEDESFSIGIEIKSNNPHNSINEQLAKILEKFGIREELRSAVDECKKLLEDENAELEEAVESGAFAGMVPENVIKIKDPETILNLKESSGKSAAFCFGRNNPMTTGHLLLWEEVSKAPADYHFIYTSHTQDKKKNPLDYDTKANIIEQCIRDYNLNAEFVKTEARTYIDVLVELFHKGFNNLVVVAGKDRLEDLVTLAQKYNDVPNKEGNAYHFDSITGHEAGDRDPDSDGVNGISGTKMRQFIKDGDFDSFYEFFPVKKEEVAKEVFEKAKAVLG